MFQIKMLELVPHQMLHEGLVPRTGATWEKIKSFASTFDAYKLDGVDSLPDLASKNAGDVKGCTLSELRASLFFEYRRYNHFGYDPDRHAMKHIHALVEEIRKPIQNGEHL